MTDQAPADWYSDPFGRHELRHWDGSRWTEHVFTQGRQSVDLIASNSVSAVPSSSLGTRNSKRLRRGISKAGVTVGARLGGGTILTEPVLVITRKKKLFGSFEYEVLDQFGTRLGALRGVRKSPFKQAFEVVDELGQVVLTVRTPTTFVRSRMVVDGRDGNEIGRIVQHLGIVDVGFGLVVGRETVGAIRDESGKSREFTVRNGATDQIARVVRMRVGGGFLLEIQGSISGPLRSLIVAAALLRDISLKREADQERLARKRARRDAWMLGE